MDKVPGRLGFAVFILLVLLFTLLSVFAKDGEPSRPVFIGFSGVFLFIALCFLANEITMVANAYTRCREYLCPIIPPEAPADNTQNETGDITDDTQNLIAPQNPKTESTDPRDSPDLPPPGPSRSSGAPPPGSTGAAGSILGQTVSSSSISTVGTRSTDSPFGRNTESSDSPTTGIIPDVSGDTASKVTEAASDDPTASDTSDFSSEGPQLEKDQRIKKHLVIQHVERLPTIDSAQPEEQP